MSKFAEAMKEVNTEHATRDAVAAVGAALGQAAAIQQAVEGIQFEDRVPTEKQFFSLGHVCQLVQQPPAIVREIMRRADVGIALSLNDVIYIDGPNVLKIHHWIQERRQEAEQCQQSN